MCGQAGGNHLDRLTATEMVGLWGHLAGWVAQSIAVVLAEGGLVLAPAGGVGARRRLALFPGGTKIAHKWPWRARNGDRSTGPRPNRLVCACFRGG